jgi:SAM-dependent methyltransferase
MKMQQSDFGARWRKRFEAYGDSGTGDAEIAGWSANGLATRFASFQAVFGGDVQGSVWLDVGCGAGTYSEYLTERGIKVFGLDYSLPSLRKANARYSGPSGWVVADALQLSVRNDAVDGVVCFGVAQAVDDIEQLIGELVRVARPGGQIWIDALNSRCLPLVWRNLLSSFKGEPGRLRFDSMANIKTALDFHGAELVRVHRLVVLPVRFKWLQDSLNRVIRIAGWLSPFMSIFCHALVVEARVGKRVP